MPPQAQLYVSTLFIVYQSGEFMDTSKKNKTKQSKTKPESGSLLKVLKKIVIILLLLCSAYKIECMNVGLF